MMGYVLSNPIRREAEVFLIPRIFLIHSEVLLFIEHKGYKARSVESCFTYQQMEYCAIIYYHFSSFVTAVPASILSMVIYSLQNMRGRSLFFSVLSQSGVISILSLIVWKESRFIRGNDLKSLLNRCLHPVFAGYLYCLKFVREERNEVYTNNLPVLWNRLLI